MYPSEIREHILAERERSRRVLDEARSIARSVLDRRDEESVELRSIADRLEAELASLFEEEEEFLDPLLREMDAWGAERASELEAYHRAQRRVVRLSCREVLQGRMPAWRAALEVLELVDSVGEGLDRSERAFLNPDLLRDDLVSIRQSGG